jgi:glycosyltransferase involved in cell wall biosynthesis
VDSSSTSADCQFWTINGRFTGQRMTGVQRYAHEIVNALDRILTEQPDLAARIKFELLVPPGAQHVPTTLSRIRIRNSSFGSGHFWDQVVLRRNRQAGVLSLGNSGPVAIRNHILCIHDANTFIAPDSYSMAFRLGYKTMLPLVARTARRVATVSAFSAKMLAAYGISRPDKMFIAPNGHEHALRWNANAADLALFVKLARPFVILLGSKARHKNTQIVLGQAAALDRAGIDIAVVGSAAGIFSRQEQLVDRPNIHQLGYVTDDDLAALYARAICLAFPSITEGFGIPLLEAMALGCPVVSSTAASLQEVGGDAAVYVGPDDGARWAEAIIGMAGNSDLRVELTAKGRRRARLFSWNKSAEIYLGEILKVSGFPIAPDHSPPSI